MTNTDPLIMDDDMKSQKVINHQTETQPELTPIQSFYDNSNIFITGATGFLGKILVEKLLRSCSTLSTIYVLVRNKKGKNLATRVEEIFDDVLFDTLKRKCPKFRHKIVGVAGDCSLPDLGISLQDRQILIKEVNIVFHVAATVRFDEKLKTAVAINVRAPQDLLTMAQQMPKLKSLMHVSTAFSNCPYSSENGIEEKIYPPSINFTKLIPMVESLSDKMLDNLTPVLLGKYPNTYAYTKQIAEHVIEQCGRGLPVGIVRPSIVVSTYREPVRAWINNMYGATGVSTGAGVGLIRCLHCDANCNANIVPVDMCVNSVIAAAWEVGTSFEKCKEEGKEFELPLYNFESSNDNPITWRTFMELSLKYGILTPSSKAIWYYSFRLIKSYILYLIVSFFIHTVPAFFVDGVLMCLGKPTRLLKIYKKIHKFSAVIAYFATKTFVFKSENVQKLCQKMTSDDNEIFFCDMKKLNWDDFFQYYLVGVRVYLLQDSLDTLRDAKIKWNRLFWAHQVTKAVAVFLLIRIIWYFVSCMF